MSPHPTQSPFYMLVGGLWVHLEGAKPGAAVAASRASLSFASSGGTVAVQRAQRSNRSWSIDFQLADPETVRWLALAASGLAGPVYLYDVSLAQTNMLDPRDVVGRVSGAATIRVEGVLLPTFASGYTLTRQLRAGISYWLGGYTSASAATNVLSYDIGAGAVNVAAPTGTGSRAFSATFIPGADVTVTIAVLAGGAAKVTALRLTEGSVDSAGFMPGQNTPCQVSVSDPQEVRQFAFSDRPGMSDYSVTMQEVG